MYEHSKLENLVFILPKVWIQSKVTAPDSWLETGFHGNLINLCVKPVFPAVNLLVELKPVLSHLLLALGPEAVTR